MIERELMKKENIIKQIAAKERMMEMFRKFRIARQGNNPDGINRIEVPSDWNRDELENPELLSDPKTATTWKSVDIPEEIVAYLNARNAKHFGQAQGTPFPIPPLSTQINWEAATMTAELVLEGDYTDEELDDITSLLLRHCKKESDLDAIPCTITEKEFRSRFRTWSERTTTSPSGRHLGHFKALLVPVANHLDDNKAEAVLQGQKKMIQAQLVLINYALQHGYSYRRWQDVVNVMIWKQPGNCKVHKLRIIHLYEADYNFILGLKWKQTLYRAVHANTFHHTEQHGGRPGRDAASLALFEELKNDICHASRRALVNFDNDAASCYDRIISSLASLAARKFRLQRNVVKVKAQTLQRTRFCLKTATGISDHWISHSPTKPIYGTGQGSGNSPVIWGLISSILFAAHGDQSHGATFISPDGSITVTVSIVGFVDDSTGQVNKFDQPQEGIYRLLLRMMEHDAQLWAALLGASGGKLELDKCSFHLLHFVFDATGRPQPEISIANTATLEVHDQTANTTHRIQAKSPYEAHKTLGHWKSPAGNSSTHLQFLHDKCSELLRALRATPTTRLEAIKFYQAIFLPAMAYSLGQSTFEPRQLESLEKKTTTTLLSECGWNRCTARAVVFAPSALGGINSVPFHVLQGHGQLKNFLKHWRVSDSIGDSLRIAVHWAQHHPGSGYAILAHPHHPIPKEETR